MSANDVKKRRSQAACSSKAGKGSSPNEGNVTPKSAASSIKAAQAKKLSHPNEKIPASDDLASNETAAKIPQVSEGLRPQRGDFEGPPGSPGGQEPGPVREPGRDVQEPGYLMWPSAKRPDRLLRLRRSKQS
jgi:hypothetical protein